MLERVGLVLIGKFPSFFLERVGLMSDSVNMYASCWILTKTTSINPTIPKTTREGSVDLEKLEI